MPCRGVLYIENISLYLAVSQILADDNILIKYISEYIMKRFKNFGHRF